MSLLSCLPCSSCAQCDQSSQLAFLCFTIQRMFLSSLTLHNTSSFLTWLVQLVIHSSWHVRVLLVKLKTTSWMLFFVVFSMLIIIINMSSPCPKSSSFLCYCSCLSRNLVHCWLYWWLYSALWFDELLTCVHHNSWTATESGCCTKHCALWYD